VVYCRLRRSLRVELNLKVEYGRNRNTLSQTTSMPQQRLPRMDATCRTFFGEDDCARRGGTQLASLPLTVLDLTEVRVETFSLWGIRTLGMLAALPE
jgi:hypothetical protein